MKCLRYRYDTGGDTLTTVSTTMVLLSLNLSDVADEIQLWYLTQIDRVAFVGTRGSLSMTTMLVRQASGCLSRRTRVLRTAVSEKSLTHLELPKQKQLLDGTHDESASSDRSVDCPFE